MIILAIGALAAASRSLSAEQRRRHARKVLFQFALGDRADWLFSDPDFVLDYLGAQALGPSEVEIAKKIARLAQQGMHKLIFAAIPELRELVDPGAEAPGQELQRVVRVIASTASGYRVVAPMHGRMEHELHWPERPYPGSELRHLDSENEIVLHIVDSAGKPMVVIRVREVSRTNTDYATGTFSPGGEEERVELNEFYLADGWRDVLLAEHPMGGYYPSEGLAAAIRELVPGLEIPMSLSPLPWTKDAPSFMRLSRTPALQEVRYQDVKWDLVTAWPWSWWLEQWKRPGRATDLWPDAYNPALGRRPDPWPAFMANLITWLAGQQSSPWIPSSLEYFYRSTLKIIEEEARATPYPRVRIEAGGFLLRAGVTAKDGFFELNASMGPEVFFTGSYQDVSKLYVGLNPPENEWVLKTCSDDPAVVREQLRLFLASITPEGHSPESGAIVVKSLRQVRSQFQEAVEGWKGEDPRSSSTRLW